MLPKFSNTAIVIISYNPQSDFINILDIHHKIAKNVIIIDNGSSNINEWQHLLRKDTFIIKSNVNKGIAWGLNIGIQKAWELESEFVITFDQDSTPVPNILNLYAQHIDDTVGLIGTTFSIHSVTTEIMEVEHNLTLITSGCLHPRKTWNIVGKYKENLFIDSVDFDYSIRTKLKGLKVLRSKQPLIKHHLGNPIKKYGIISSNHSVIRRYYMARNHIYLSKQYLFKVPFFILKKNYTFFKEFVKIILVENNKSVKIKAIFKGIKDGIKL